MFVTGSISFVCSTSWLQWDCTRTDGRLGQFFKNGALCAVVIHKYMKASWKKNIISDTQNPPFLLRIGYAEEHIPVEFIFTSGWNLTQPYGIFQPYVTQDRWCLWILLRSDSTPEWKLGRTPFRSIHLRKWFQILSVEKNVLSSSWTSCAFYTAGALFIEAVSLHVMCSFT